MSIGARETRNTEPELTVVIPVYDEKENVKPLAHEIISILEKQERRYEIVFVDDGSRDGSSDVIRELAEEVPEIRAIFFRKNFGKAAALSAGFSRSRGEILITLDGDQQDNPAEIPRMIAQLESGYDLVSGWKKKRRDPLTKTIPSRFFNLATSFISGLRLHDYNCGFKIYRREVVENLDLYGELHRYIPALAHRKGFRVGEIPVDHRRRIHGRSKYGIGRFTKGFLDLITVFFLTRFMRRPLHLFGVIGILFFIAGTIINGYLSVLWFQGRSIGYRPLLFLGVLCVIVGIQMLTTGLLGEMMAHFINRRESAYIVRDEVE